MEYAGDFCGLIMNDEDVRLDEKMMNEYGLKESWIKR